MVHKEGQETEKEMSQKSEQNAGAFMDTVLAIVGFALVATVAWNFYEIRNLTGQIEANTIHSCWIMEYIFGPPGDITSREACLEMREQLPGWWNR